MPYRILFFIIVLLLLDAGIGFVLRPYYRAATLPAYQEFYSKYVSAPAPFDIVFFGDSRIQHGVNTPLLSNLCQCHAGNLAVSGSTPASTYYLLRDYLAHNRPRLVVLEAHWSRLGRQDASASISPLLLEMLPARDQADYAISSLDLNFIAAKTLYSYRYRQSLSSLERAIKSKLSGKALATSTQEELGRPDQFVPATGVIGSQSDIQLQAFQLLHPFDLPPDPVQVKYLERILSMLNAENIPVVLLQPPEPLDASETITHFKELTKLITDTAKADSVPYIDFDDPADPLLKNADNFSDVLHLNATGAAIYTQKLWDALRPLL